MSIALVDARLQYVLEQLPTEGKGPDAWKQMHDAFQRLEEAIERDDANATQAGLCDAFRGHRERV